ncbi:thioredoxin family protein [uncultured Piscinibacter sp.]|uniref:thioredoxin family protein n=1 Tax=uncultured Piscinibacter sp. TaxID=1131835 RepID=UPI002637D37F|nr:thioredoxin family protein [uncultured Piscinibacter sp.]
MARNIHVACLCAAWCRLCDEYAAVLTASTEAFRTHDVPLQVHWIDIEDDAELVGSFDVETFPTIVIVADGQVRFAGPVRPQADTLLRLLRATVLDNHADAPASAFPAEVLAFADRLGQGTGHRPPIATR